MLSNKCQTFSVWDLFSMVNDERIVNENAKKQEDKGILYIQRDFRLRCKDLSRWNGSLIVLE